MLYYFPIEPTRLRFTAMFLYIFSMPEGVSGCDQI